MINNLTPAEQEEIRQWIRDAVESGLKDFEQRLQPTKAEVLAEERPIEADPGK